MTHPVIEAARQAAQGGWLMGGMTVYFFLFFIGYAAWAWWPSNKRHMDEMARLPLDDDDEGQSWLLRTGGSR